MNAPTISKENIPVILDMVRFASSALLKGIRLDAGMAELTKGEHPDWETVDYIRANVPKGMNVTLVFNCIAGNNAYWRKYLTSPDRSDEAVWTEWKDEEAQGHVQSWNAPRGVRPELWAPMKGFWLEYATRWPEATIQIGNEVGNTVNDRARLWDIPYGTCHPQFHEYAYPLAKKLKEMNRKVIHQAYEHETIEGLNRQIWTGFGLHTPLCDSLALNLYVHWDGKESAKQWARRALQEAKAVSDSISMRKPMVLTEVGCPNLPAHRYSEFFEAFQSQAPPTLVWHWYGFGTKDFDIRPSLRADV